MLLIKFTRFFQRRSLFNGNDILTGLLIPYRQYCHKNITIGNENKWGIAGIDSIKFRILTIMRGQHNSDFYIYWGRFNPATFLSLSKGPRFPMPYFVVMFNDLKYQVTNLFVDIGEIINHPCLNFLFKIGFAA